MDFKSNMVIEQPDSRIDLASQVNNIRYDYERGSTSHRTVRCHWGFVVGVAKRLARLRLGASSPITQFPSTFLGFRLKTRRN
ncbi:hypothetical protein GQ457_03G030360 [Hibiscus cannabinus]